MPEVTPSHRFHTRHAAMWKAIASGDARTIAAWMIETETELLNVHSDHDRLASILDGSWNGAVEILERALEKARKAKE